MRDSGFGIVDSRLEDQGSGMRDSAADGESVGETGREAGRANAALRGFDGVREAVQDERWAVRVVNRERRARVAVARLTDRAWVHEVSRLRRQREVRLVFSVGHEPVERVLAAAEDHR